MALVEEVGREEVRVVLVVVVVVAMVTGREEEAVANVGFGWEREWNEVVLMVRKGRKKVVDLVMVGDGRSRQGLGREESSNGGNSEGRKLLYF
ncbi:hypothetical protein ACH5RR_029110 [Cinchona calisaya]|uniref:Uncharacterized protein n=1 Tax=Cinchona calisaya TaxID=153742 RepID=A0ABD2YU67_9GENT